MPYMCELTPGQTLYLSQQGNQTLAVLSTQQPGQQQQSSSSFATGRWVREPNVFCTPLCVVVSLHTDQGDRHLQIQGGSMSLVHNSPGVRAEQQLPLRVTDQMPGAGSSIPMEPMSMEPMTMEPMTMEPMSNQPMTMGSMSMNPMEMRMGNMEMRMGSSASAASSAASARASTSKSESGTTSKSQTSDTPGQRRFCSQCGAEVTPDARFCSSCGHRLE